MLRALKRDIAIAGLDVIPGHKYARTTFPRAYAHASTAVRRALPFDGTEESRNAPQRRRRPNEDDDVEMYGPHPQREHMSRYLKSRNRSIQNTVAFSSVGQSRARHSMYAEVKRVTVASQTQPASDTVIKITGPAQGDAVSQRIGDQVKVLELVFNYIIMPNAAQAGDEVQGYRLTIFQWNPDDSAAGKAPVIGDLYNTSAGSGQCSLVPLNIGRKPLYNIILDIAGTLAGPIDTPLVGSNCTGIQKLRFRIPRKTLDYNEGVSTGMNQLYFFFRSADLTDNAGVAMPVMSYMTQLRFIDS